MAQGDFTVFDQFILDLGNKIMDMDGDTFKIGLITSAATPATTTAGPHWGGTGTTNFATNEVTPGGNYAANGPSLTSVTWSLSGGQANWDSANVSILQNGANPTNVRWGIIYDDTDANKRCVGYLDFGSDTDLTAGDLTVTVHANGWFSGNQ